MHQVLRLRGTLSGEHGIGNVKSKFIDLELGPRELALMRSLKAALDPNHILNPGKVFPPSRETTP